MYSFGVPATNALGDGPAATSNTIAAHCTNSSVTLIPATNETVSIDYGTPVNAPNPSVTAKRDTRCAGICVNHDIYGWTKFDVAGSIPAWGQITWMTLNLNS